MYTPIFRTSGSSGRSRGLTVTASDVPMLAPSGLNDTSATLTLSNRPNAWRYKGNQSGARCTSVAANTATASLPGHDPPHRYRPDQRHGLQVQSARRQQRGQRDGVRRIGQRHAGAVRGVQPHGGDTRRDRQRDQRQDLLPDHRQRPRRHHLPQRHQQVHAHEPAGRRDGLTELEILFLTSNGLTSLPARVFDDLAALASLNLSNNDLTSLPVYMPSGCDLLYIINGAP